MKLIPCVLKSLWGSERYQNSENAIREMEDIKCNIEEYMGNLEDLCDSISEVMEG